MDRIMVLYILIVPKESYSFEAVFFVHRRLLIPTPREQGQNPGISENIGILSLKALSRTGINMKTCCDTDSIL
jgi:hypothetical protein